MNNHIIFTTICFIVFHFSAISQGIHFESGSYSQALEKAKNTQKLLFLDAYTTWCGPCKEMGDNVFTDSTVGSFMNQRFLSLKVDIEKGEGPELMKRFNIKAFPTLLIINPDGEEIHRMVGGRNAKQLIQDLTIGSSAKSCLMYVSKSYHNGDHSPKIVANYLYGLVGSMDKSTAETIALEYFNTLSDNERCHKKNSFIYSYAPHINHPIFNYLIDNQNLLRKKIGNILLTQLIDAVCPDILMNEQNNFKEKDYFRLKYPDLYRLVLQPSSKTAIILQTIDFLATQKYLAGIQYLIDHITQLDERHQIFFLYQFGPYSFKGTSIEYQALSELYQIVHSASNAGFVKRATQNLMIVLRKKINEQQKQSS